MRGKARWSWASICGCWRAGFTANRAKAKSSFAKEIGRTGGFCERVRGCWRRRKKKNYPQQDLRNKKQRARKQNEAGCDERRYSTIRREISGRRWRRPFPRSAVLRSFVPGDRHGYRPTERKK